MKRAIFWILTAAIMLGLCACGAPAAEVPEPTPEPPAQKYTTAADLTLLYADAEAWSADAVRAGTLLSVARKTLSALETPKGALAFAEQLFDGALPEKLARLESYLRMSSLLGIEEDALPAMEKAWAELTEEHSAIRSEARAELLALEEEAREALFAEESLASYEKDLRALILPVSTDTDEKREAESLRAAQEAPDFTLPNGKTKPLTEKQFRKLLRGDYDREVVVSAENAYLARYAEAVPELAELLQKRWQALQAGAETEEMSLRDYALRLSGRDGEELAALRESIRSLAPVFRDYAENFGVRRGCAPLLAELDPHELTLLAALPYESAADTVILSLAPSGERVYRLFAPGHVELNAPETGLFPAGTGETPFVLLNRKESEIPPEELAALAYGAALVRDGETPTDADGVYAALLTELWMLKRSESETEKQEILERILSRLSREVLLPGLFAELEEYLLTQTEAGYDLNGEDICEKCYGLLRDYVGESAALGEGARYLWTEADELFEGYGSFLRAADHAAAAVRAWENVRGGADETDFSMIYTALAEEYAALRRG